MVLILSYIKQNCEPVNYLYLVKIYSITQYIVNLLIFGKRFIMYIFKQESNYCFDSHCNRNVNEYSLSVKLFLFMCFGHLPLISYLWSFFMLISVYALLLLTCIINV